MDVVIERRELASTHQLSQLPPLLQRVLTGRGVLDAQSMDYQLKYLLPFSSLSNIDAAATRLATAVTQQQSMLIVGDFDVDGATSTALAVTVLRDMGAKHVSYLVPNRFEYGYGLSPEIVDVAARQKPDLIITVDNGISSLAGVERAVSLGIDVLITDHHLPGDTLPSPCIIVNPSLPDDAFPSQALAGVGVIFYVMLALRAALTSQGWFERSGMSHLNMSQYLDLVALGTVADLVPLDKNNRILVKQGIRRIQQYPVRPGIQALMDVSKREVARLTASDFGFAIAPRLNAAGRLDDMTLGIECLLCHDLQQARAMAQQLDQLNSERKAIEQQMKQEALALVSQREYQADASVLGLCLHEPDWHQGVVGLVASRIKDQVHRPVIAFADAGNNELKGSGRSIPGLNLRDILQRVDVMEPGLIIKFGGHAMAAGLSIPTDLFDRFSLRFNEAVSLMSESHHFAKTWLTDGELSPDEFTLDMACLLRDHGPWGQAFPEPIFDGVFNIVEQRLVGGQHLKLQLQHPESAFPVEAIAFFINPDKWPNLACTRLKVIYQMDVNHFRSQRQLQLIIQYMEEVA